MNDDVANNPLTFWPQLTLSSNDPYISGNVEIPVDQHVSNTSSTHPQQQPQNVSSEWCDPSNNELCDAFFQLNESDQAVLFKDLDEILTDPISLDELYPANLEHALMPHDLAASASSSQSMIQSPPSDFSYSTSSQSSPTSNSQSMLQSSPSTNPEPILQQHELGYNVPVLDISIQPENTFRFRYKSETKDPHGYLRGACSAGNNFRRNTTVDLRLNHANDIDENLFVRCILHQAAFETYSALIHAPLSPHQLQRRSDGKLYDETELFALRKVTPNLYSFVLDNFLITLTPIDQCQQNCLTKLEVLNQHNLTLGSQLLLNVAGVDLEEANPGTKKKKKQPLKKPIQVQIGFEAFRCINGAYVSIAGPIFSNTITHGEPLNIVRICTPCVLKDEETENTILVSPLKTLDVKIHLQECGNVASPWRECIDVNKRMVHNKSAITFQIPKYSGNQQHLANIECNIQLERLCDGAWSNIRTFFYTNGLKRCRPGGDATISTITKRRAHLEDHLALAQHSLNLQPDAVVFTDTTTSRRDLKTISFNENPRSMLQIEERMRTELSINPLIRSQSFVKTSEQIDNGIQNTRKFNKELSSFLCDIRCLYNKSKNSAIKKKQDYARLVRHYFLDYEREHPAGNSILHDILADTDLKEYEIVLYKIIEHFELEDVVRQSRNIYGETALMFACMFKRPLLVSALINMGTSIAAQDVDKSSNVLHIAMQKQSEECLKSLIQAMKISKNAASFIKALGSYNVRGLTPLHLAVLQNNVPIVTEFLQFCKRHNALEACQRGQMSDGNTILHLAVLNRFVKMRACILENFGDSLTNVINFSGETAAEIMSQMDVDLETLADSLGGIQLQEVAPKC